MELHYKTEVQIPESPIEQTNLVHLDCRPLLQLGRLRNSALRTISMAKRHQYYFRSLLPVAGFLGLKGAALAAFGDKPKDFVGWLGPLTVRLDGVKLGESTLKRFLRLGNFSISTILGFSTAQLLTCLMAEETQP